MKKHVEFINCRMAEACTSNVTQGDCELLDRWDEDSEGQRPLVWYQKPGYGWFVHVNDLHKEKAIFTKEAKAYGFSKAFITLVLAASKQGFSWVDIDRDAEPVDGLPEFDW